MDDIVKRLEGYDYRPQEAIDEIKRLRAENAMLRTLLVVADEAINPIDVGGISMETWNKRLKAATIKIRAAAR